MAELSRATANELVLSIGQFAYTQDTTSGVIKTHTGPAVVNITGQEYPVVFDKDTKQFRREDLTKAAQQSPLVPRGSYVALSNPASDGKQPQEASKEAAKPLHMGQRVNIPGPATFALWPRQHAEVITGHQLRSNEYLLVRVYDEKEAQENWDKAIVVGTSGTGEPGTQTDKKPQSKAKTAPAGVQAQDLSDGKLIIIKGTEVSFFIPPTGIEVVQDADGKYVREALTLERLQYCILVDEDGNKDYQRGPKVVFPKPTERFFEMQNKDGTTERVFRPIELNPIQGLHIKVIADYEEEIESGKDAEKPTTRIHKEGDELFITGKDTPIYFPRNEHSLIAYDGQSKHFAVAVPNGEARYVMHRETGEIKTMKGPAMLLTDPRNKVIVRRALSERQCDLWYPGNLEAKEHNKGLRELAKNAPTTRTGVVSEGEYERTRGGGAPGSAKSLMMNMSTVSNNSALAVLADQFTRGSSFTQPRSVTIDSKYSGVPAIDIWTGYAVMIVAKGGQRRVEVGPKTVLLDYDESLETLSLSTGKPKSADKPLHTAYLRVQNNQISDYVTCETKDHVSVDVRLSLRVNFEGDPKKWFDAENYIKLLTDHVRSVLKGAVRKLSIEEFYANPADIVRDTLLGAKKDGSARQGMAFKENGMVLSDVEVLSTIISDEGIQELIQEAQHFTVQSAIEHAKSERQLEVEKKKSEQEAVRANLKKVDLVRKTELVLLENENAIKESESKLARQEASEAVNDHLADSSLARTRKKEENDIEIARSKADIEAKKLVTETASVVDRFKAFAGPLSEAISQTANSELLTRIMEAGSFQTLLGGKEKVADTLVGLAAGTTMETAFKKVLTGSPQGLLGRPSKTDKTSS